MELNRIHNCTAIDLLSSLKNEVPLIAADPPWGIDYHGTSMGKIPAMRDGVYLDRLEPRKHGKGTFDDSVIDTSWIPHAYEALQDGGAMYLFTRWDVLHEWRTAVLKAGFKVVQRIVWDKALWGAGDLRYFGSQTEDILVCVKGPHHLRWDKREGNVWHIVKGPSSVRRYRQESKVWRIGKGRVMGKDGGGRHSTQKPVDLFSRIISYSSDIDDLVVDPFTGSGAACIAAQRLHRRFVGCDINSEFAAAAQKWLEKTAKRTRPMMGIHA